MRTVDPVKHAARRRQIVHAAAHVFAEHGFEAASTAKICKAAGVSTGALFHYFANKREIFVAVLTDDDDDTAAQLAACLSLEDPLAGLLAFVTHLAAAAEHAVVPPLVLEAMLQAGRDPELAAKLDQTSGDEQAGITALLERAADRGLVDLPFPVGETASAIMSMVSALYLRAATEPGFDADTAITNLDVTVRRLLKADGG